MIRLLKTGNWQLLIWDLGYYSAKLRFATKYRFGIERRTASLPASCFLLPASCYALWATKDRSPCGLRRTGRSAGYEGQVATCQSGAGSPHFKLLQRHGNWECYSAKYLLLCEVRYEARVATKHGLVTGNWQLQGQNSYRRPSTCSGQAVAVTFPCFPCLPW